MGVGDELGGGGLRRWRVVVALGRKPGEETKA
jgi:hypothetical protein